MCTILPTHGKRVINVVHHSPNPREEDYHRCAHVINPGTGRRRDCYTQLSTRVWERESVTPLSTRVREQERELYTVIHTREQERELYTVIHPGAGESYTPVYTQGGTQVGINHRYIPREAPRWV